MNKDGTLTPAKKQKLIEGTLKFVNKIRGKLGLKPVTKLSKGVPNSPERCVIANSIRGRSTRMQVEVSPMPTPANSFILVYADVDDLEPVIDSKTLSVNANKLALAFDRGQFPEYEASV